MLQSLTDAVGVKREGNCVCKGSLAGLFLPAALLAVFLAANFLTATRQPTVWVDETGYTDPAANLSFGQGFTSSAWPGQPYGTFWAGNVPLHQFLLAGWFRIFGFSLCSARAMNYVLIATVAVVLWKAFRRFKLINTNTLGYLAVAVILCDSGVTMSYRSARPDCIGMLLIALAFLAFTVRDNSRRRLILVILGLLFPVAGLQLAAFATLLGGVFVIWTRGRHFKDFFAIGIGMMLGGAALAALYAGHGVLQNFILGVTKYSDIGIPHQSLWQRMSHLTTYLTVDKSQMLVVAAALLWLALKRLGVLYFQSRPLVFGILAWLVVTSGMAAAGKFAIYYAWMTVMPLVVCFVSTLESTWQSNRRKTPCYAAIVLLFLAAAIGLPMKLCVTAFAWRARDFAVVTDYVRPYAQGRKWLYADYLAYFGLKNSNNVVVTRPYLETMTPAEKSRIRFAVVESQEAAVLPEWLGGRWKPVADPLVMEWKAVHNPNPFIRRLACRWTTHPQDADWRLCIYERLPE